MPAASAVAEAAAHAVAPAVVVVVVVVPAITAVEQKKQDKSKIESLTAEQLSYSHSDARLQNKAEFIDGVMTRKGTLKSLEWPA